jgi:hypothetical protein
VSVPVCARTETGFLGDTHHSIFFEETRFLWMLSRNGVSDRKERDRALVSFFLLFFIPYYRLPITDYPLPIFSPNAIIKKVIVRGVKL